MTGAARQSSPWIRGVNIGGWLLLERFITPYMFAITSCHVQGDFCFYPGQLSAPPNHDLYCDKYQCDPLFLESDKKDAIPIVDEWTLAQSFPNKALAKQWLTYHWENFVTKENVHDLKKAGVTHVRVPMPHWIMGDIRDDEPWVDGQWLHFIRFVGWCREYNIQVWPDIHTAPGSQNGFDNSGQVLQKAPICPWSDSNDNVERSLQVVKDISEAILRDNLQDVVTGIGVLNEPFHCDANVIKSFYDEALLKVRNILGEDTAVFIGDTFNATDWNTGWWTDEDEFSNTFLDSHYYHAFDAKTRALTPKQHIAYTCTKDTRDTRSCCYEDAPTDNEIPSKGISRLVGEWSASFDTLPVAKLEKVMKGIYKDFTAPELKRELPAERKDFLKQFVKAQMVAYESASITGLSRGWFYWTLKMEGGAFAEWDFLRGWEEKWIPSLPATSESAESIFGSCEEIAEKTKDDESIVHQFPDPSAKDTPEEYLWSGPDIVDEYVVSHAGSLVKEKGGTLSSAAAEDDNDVGTTSAKTIKDESKGTDTKETDTSDSNQDTDKTLVDGKGISDAKSRSGHQYNLFPLFAIGFFCYAMWHVFFKQQNQGGSQVPYSNIVTPSFQQFGTRGQYTDLDAPSALSA